MIKNLSLIHGLFFLEQLFCLREIYIFIPYKNEDLKSLDFPKVGFLAISSLKIIPYMNAKPDQAETKIVERLEEGLLQLGDVYRKHQSYIKTKYQISALEMEIIQLVDLEGPKRMKDIGGYFDVKLSTLTSVVDKIEKQGLVKRVNSQEDRRVVLLQVSRKGKKLHDQYQRYLHVIALLTHRNMNPNEFSGFLEGLEKISEILTVPEPA